MFAQCFTFLLIAASSKALFCSEIHEIGCLVGFTTTNHHKIPPLLRKTEQLDPEIGGNYQIFALFENKHKSKPFTGVKMLKKPNGDWKIIKMETGSNQNEFSANVNQLQKIDNPSETALVFSQIVSAALKNTLKGATQKSSIFKIQSRILQETLGESETNDQEKEQAQPEEEEAEDSSASTADNEGTDGGELPEVGASAEDSDAPVLLAAQGPSSKDEDESTLRSPIDSEIPAAVLKQPQPTTPDLPESAAVPPVPDSKGDATKVFPSEPPFSEDLNQTDQPKSVEASPTPAAPVEQRKPDQPKEVEAPLTPAAPVEQRKPDQPKAVEVPPTPTVLAEQPKLTLPENNSKPAGQPVTIDSSKDPIVGATQDVTMTSVQAVDLPTSAQPVTLTADPSSTPEMAVFNLPVTSGPQTFYAPPPKIIILPSKTYTIQELDTYYKENAQVYDFVNKNPVITIIPWKKIQATDGSSSAPTFGSVG